MITTRGKVFIGTRGPYDFPAAAQFTTDPKIEREWPPRLSVLKGIAGAVKIQDFDLWAADMRLTLTSDGNYINQAFKAYLDGLRAVKNALYDYKDYTGIEATVKILDFKPKPTFIKDGKGVLWEYQLTLQVSVLSVLDFAAYSGN
jgi:hypothetical protein